MDVEPISLGEDLPLNSVELHGQCASLRQAPATTNFSQFLDASGLRSILNLLTTCTVGMPSYAG